MAIARVAIPTPTSPVALADYQAILDQITALNQAFTGRNIVDGSTIHASSLMMVGGVLYKATSDTTITGTPSNYVKITPSGASAAAAFVASLTGVTWNHAYGGYYDGSGNLYLFDEARAINEGAGPTTAYTLRGQIAYMKGGLDLNGDLTGVTNLTMSGDLIADDITADSVTASGDIATSAGNLSGKLSSATYTNDTTMPAMLINERRSVTWTVDNNFNDLRLPTGSVFAVLVLSIGADNTATGGVLAGGTTIGVRASVNSTSSNTYRIVRLS